MTELETTTQRLARFDTARFGLELLMANCSRLIHAEESKAKPDQATIDQLMVKRREYSMIRNGLDFENRAQIEGAIATYCLQAKAIMQQVPE